jgi:glycosyltransferase involved in cell wall biosynthesis
MRVCIVYDCLFPYTVGGAERWYRNLAERLAAAGHDVTYLTLRQWDRHTRPDIDERVRVVVAGPRMGLYTTGGRRRMLPPLVFGLGVLMHLLRYGGRYDVVHSDSFPYFSLLAAGLARPLRRFGLVVDWFEVWSGHYWREYLGRVGGAIGSMVQKACARVPQRAFCFSQLHAARLREEGLRGEITLLTGLYRGSLKAPAPVRAKPLVVYAGRMIPEKRVPAGVAAVAAAAARIAGLEGIFFGDGPDRQAVLEAIRSAGAQAGMRAPGFASAEDVESAMRQALCMLLPSRREGYGMVVVEAASMGTPSIVVAAEDNAATELIEEGVNGFVAAGPDADVIADAIVRVNDQGMALRERTAAWFADNASRLSLESSLEAVLESYAQPSARA